MSSASRSVPRVNEEITAPHLRLIGPTGIALGIHARDDALDYAARVGLDLVEVAPDARPPVCRLLKAPPPPSPPAAGVRHPRSPSPDRPAASAYKRLEERD